MSAYVVGQDAAFELYFGKTASLGSRISANYQGVKQQLRRAAVVGQIGLAGVGGVGATQALQQTPAGSPKAQIALNALGGGVGGIGGAAAGGVTGGLEGVGSGFNKGVDIGKGLMQPEARARMGQVAF